MLFACVGMVVCCLKLSRKPGLNAWRYDVWRGLGFLPTLALYVFFAWRGEDALAGATALAFLIQAGALLAFTYGKYLGTIAYLAVWSYVIYSFNTL